MNNGSLDFVFAIGSLIIGVLLLTGNGAIFMGGGNKDKRKQIYDQKKMEMACGVAMILVAAVTAIDAFTTSIYAKIGYTLALIVIFVGLFVYIRMKCRKK